MGRIVLFGATGYTGRLAAEALVRRGARPLLAGRSEHRLREVAAGLGGLDHAVADVARPAALRALLEPGDVLLSTVGPFKRWGSTAVETAIAGGAHYIDSTGEPPFIRRVFEEWGGQADSAGVGLVTAAGYDFVPGNLAAALALERAGERAAAVHVGYFMSGRAAPREAMSGGTMASLAGVLLEPGFAWRGGLLRTERAAVRVRSFHAGGRELQGVSVAGSEHFALPRLRPLLRDVDVYLGWFGPASRAMQAFSTVGAAAARVPGLKAGADTLAARLAPGSSGGPDADARARTGSLVVAEALDAAGTSLARVELHGPNPYTYTGEMLAWGAHQAAEDGFEGGAGALGPVDAFGLRALEAANAEFGLREG
jgi:short subunit dehydrogenase-like uncharacterized protein